MANNRQVKRRISTAKNISKITKAMEMVAASKMRRAQDQALLARPYAMEMARSLSGLSEILDSSLHPLLQKNEFGAPLALVFSTDKGLCGSFNANIVKELAVWAKKNPGAQVVAIGKKAVFLSRVTGLDLYAQFVDLPEKITISDIAPISSLIFKGFSSQEFKTVQIFYMDFINTLSQKVKSIQLLPLTKKLNPLQEEEKSLLTPMLSSDYIFEPSPEAILNELLPFYVENSIYHAFLESRASEHSARMVAMKNASENAADLVDELNLIFNKSRQESITNELLEITTAQLALS